jgi:hypothetical protein
VVINFLGFLVLQIGFFGVGTYLRSSDRRSRTIIGKTLQIISGLAFFLPVIALLLFYNFGYHPRHH